MDREQEEAKKPLGKMLFLGALTAGLYVVVFANSNWIMEYFTRGAWYAALPVATVFLFSFVHGAFASNLWSVLGVGVSRKPAQPRPRKVKRLVRRRRLQPQLRLNA